LVDEELLSGMLKTTRWRLPRNVANALSGAPAYVASLTSQ